MKVTSKYNNQYDKVTTIVANAEEEIIIRASLKHYLEMVREYLPEKDIATITNMLETLKEKEVTG